MNKRKQDAIIRVSSRIIDILNKEKTDVGLEALMYCLNAWILEYEDRDWTLEYVIKSIRKGHFVSQQAAELVKTGLAIQ